MKTVKQTRRGFALSGGVILLALVLLILMGIRVAITWSNAPGGAYGMGYRIGGIAAPFLLLLIVWGIGWMVYRASGRSDAAGNATMGVIIALAAAGQGYKLYEYWTNGPAKKPAQTPSLADRSIDQLKKSNERLQELMKGPSKLSGAPVNPRPTPVNPAPTGIAIPPPSPSQTPPPAATGPAINFTPPPPRAVPKPSTDPAVQAALDQLQSEVQAQIEAAIKTLEPALAAVTKPPRTDMTDLKKRASLLETARPELKKLAERLRGLGEEAKAAASKAGSENDLRDSIKLEQKFGGMARAFACESLMRLVDQAVDETQLLKDRFGQWKVGKDGKFESKDFQLQSAANSARFYIDSRMQTKGEDLRKLRGE